MFEEEVNIADGVLFPLGFRRVGTIHADKGPIYYLREDNIVVKIYPEDHYVMTSIGLGLTKLWVGPYDFPKGDIKELVRECESFIAYKNQTSSISRNFLS